MMFRFDSRFEDERCFLCIRDARDCNVENCVLLLNDCHSLSREICDERETRTMRRLSVIVLNNSILLLI